MIELGQYVFFVAIIPVRQSWPMIQVGDVLGTCPRQQEFQVLLEVPKLFQHEHLCVLVPRTGRYMLLQVPPSFGKIRKRQVVPAHCPL